VVYGARLANLGRFAISSSNMPGGGAMRANWTVCRVNILVADSVVRVHDDEEGDGERLRKAGGSRDRRDCFPFPGWGMSICRQSEESGVNC